MFLKNDNVTPTVACVNFFPKFIIFFVLAGAFIHKAPDTGWKNVLRMLPWVGCEHVCNGEDESEVKP